MYIIHITLEEIMPLYDLDRGAQEIESKELYKKYVKPVADRLPKVTFDKMIKTVDAALNTLKPSQSSKLVWTKCAALCGYSSDLKVKDANHLWEAAQKATTFDPDGCNKFVGSLIFWRISMRSERWLSTKTQDVEGVHPYRTYWINDNFIPYGQMFKAEDLLRKFNSRL